MPFRELVAIPAFRMFAGIMFLAQVWISMVTAILAFYLVYVAGISRGNLGQAIAFVYAAALSSRLLCIPVWFKVLERVHPARVIAVSRLFLSVLMPSAFWAMRQPGVPLQPLLLIGGLLVGACDSPESMSQHMLIGWIIDEDGLAHGGTRREGMFWACNGVFQHLSEVVIAGMLAVFGASGLDSKRCPHDQPQSAQDAIEYTFLIGVPIVCVSIASLCLAYPIKGERLRLLKEALATAKAKDAPATDDGKDIQLDIARSTGLTPGPAVHDMDE